MGTRAHATTNTKFILNPSLVIASDSSDKEELDFRLPNCKVHPTGVELGHGSYGDVVEVEYNGKKYAAKKYRPISIGSIMHVFGREHQILSLVRHRNIVPYYGICKLATDNATVIVMERMEMNLSVFLEDQKNVSISITRKFQILYDVACGLNYLHTQRPAVIHRDLTATNVLLNSKGVTKIADFGNSYMMDLTVGATPDLLTSNPGTLDYMSPEALEGGYYNDRLDIFSFGHLSIYVMIQQRPHPLLRPTYREHGRLIARTEVERRTLLIDKVKTKLPGGEQHEMYSLIIRCLQDEPDHRPSCADILLSDVFSHVQ